MLLRGLEAEILSKCREGLGSAHEGCSHALGSAHQFPSNGLVSLSGRRRVLGFILLAEEAVTPKHYSKLLPYDYSFLMIHKPINLEPRVQPWLTEGFSAFLALS